MHRKPPERHRVVTLGTNVQDSVELNMGEDEDGNVRNLSELGCFPSLGANPKVSNHPFVRFPFLGVAPKMC